MARQNSRPDVPCFSICKGVMDKNSRDTQPQSDSAANASPPEKAIFSAECGPLSESEIASLKKLAQETAREALNVESDESPRS